MNHKELFVLLFLMVIPLPWFYSLHNNKEPQDLPVSACASGEAQEEWDWNGWSDRDKVHYLQTTVNSERYYLGIHDCVSIVVEDLPDGVLGDYCDENRTIRIDTEHLKNDSRMDVTKTIAHEMYHCYQHRIAELYAKLDEDEKALCAFNNCEQYLAEMKDYKSGVGEDADLVAYYNQYMEIDAREYSRQAILEHGY